MTLKEACKESLKILKQVMEEKLNATNVEVNMANALLFVRMDCYELTINIVGNQGVVMSR